jgi:hypothetical protein
VPGFTAVDIPFAPASVELWTARVAVTITGDMDTDGYPIFPTDILGRNHDTILFGTLARLMGMIAKPYSNPQMASYYQRQFKGGLAQIRHTNNMQNTYGGQRWRYPGGFTRPHRGPSWSDISGGGEFGDDFGDDLTTGGAVGALITTLPITKGQLVAAVSASLSGGLYGFETWVSAAPDDAFNIALRYADDAASLQAALMAYMQASASATPPGLGMTTDAATAQWSSLLLTAQTKPR